MAREAFEELASQTPAAAATVFRAAIEQAHEQCAEKTTHATARPCDVDSAGIECRCGTCGRRVAKLTRRYGWLRCGACDAEGITDYDELLSLLPALARHERKRFEGHQRPTRSGQTAAPGKT